MFAPFFGGWRIEYICAKDKYLIEAEAFQFKGKWSTDRSADCMGSAMLRLNGGGSLDEQFDALTVVNIMEEGDYNVWVRSADYDKLPGTRLFRLSVDEKPMKESGKHGKVGFYWENAGCVQLAKNRYYCDCMIRRGISADVTQSY